MTAAVETRDRPRGARATTSGRWRSWHLHYHGDLDRLLLELVAPAARELLAAGLAERFFFVRYQLGGPHVRLRLRPAPAEPTAAAPAERLLAARAEAFFRRRPSTDPLPAAEVRRRNRAILAAEADPAAAPDEVVPDNTLRRGRYRPETGRYGGARRLADSHELFTLSSLAVLDALAALGRGRGGDRVTHGFRLLACQALASAAGPDELPALLGYAEASAGPRFRRVLERADAVFARRSERLAALFAAAAEAAAPGPAGWLAEGARRLGRRLAGAAPGVRLRVLSSQLHMTANRLGLSGPEEVYCLRLLARSAAAAPPAARRQGGDDPPAGRRRGPGETVERALARFAAAPADPDDDDDHGGADDAGA